MDIHKKRGGSGSSGKEEVAKPDAPAEVAQASPVDVAVIWVDKAKRGRSGWVRSCPEFQLKAYRLRKRLKPVMDAVKWTMLGLAIFETPSWCLFNDEECFGTRQATLYFSGAPLMPLEVSNGLNLACLLCLVGYLLLRRISLGEADDFKPVSWHSFGLACVMLGLLDSTVAIFNVGGIIPGTFKLTRLLRPFVFLAFTTNLREAAERVVRSVPWFADVLLTLGLCLFFFVWVGIVLFAESPGGKIHFPSWAESFANLWVLFTTANNPDAWVHIYTEHRMAFLFFGSYIVITVYLLNNLILSSIYDAYKEQLGNMVRNHDENQESSLKEAFDLLADSKDPQDGSALISQETWASFFISYTKAEGNANNEAWNRKRAIEIFKILDEDKSGGLSYDEFRQVFDVLHNNKEYIPKTRPPAWAVIKRLNALLTARLQIGGVTITEELVVDAVVSVGILLAFVQTILFYNDGALRPDSLDTGNKLSVALFGLTCFYVVEVTLRLMVLGPERFWNQNAFMNRFDLINIYGLVVAESVCYSIVGYRAVGGHLVVLLHIARCLRLFRHVKQLRFIAELTVRLAPTYWRMGMLLVLIFYIFDTIGVQVFGGLIYKGNPALKGSTFEAGDYWVFNFNDFNSGMVTLFVLMVVNNWFILSSAFQRVTGSQLAAIFSVLFFIVANLIVLNVLMSLILDLSGNVREEIQEADEEAEEGGEGKVEKKKSRNYMDMVRNVLLHHDEDDASSVGRALSSKSMSVGGSSSYGAV